MMFKKFFTVCISAVVTAGILLGTAVACRHFAPGIYNTAETKIVQMIQRVKIREYKPSNVKMTDIGTMKQNKNMMLINKQNPLPEGMNLDISEFRDIDLFMNAQVKQPLESLISAVKTECGDRLFIMSAYRTRDRQAEIYQEDPVHANLPGTSEHEAGLALDVYVKYFAGEGFIQSEAGKFVNQNCWKYGFVIRYNTEKQALTGVPAEPWHIRYVGAPHAEIMFKNNLCLEEYIVLLEPAKYYRANGYVIARLKETEGKIAVPDELVSYTVSPDNQGYWILTGKTGA